eukprot:snap_masked-scaffold_77-processed-gene-0.17-mRNA-1 protein AED:1.00 eAED:1.00 QI:0/-1/0/0/-1/1/1/0/97
MKTNSVVRKPGKSFTETNSGEFFVLDTVEALTKSHSEIDGFLLIILIASKYRSVYCYNKKSQVAEELVKSLQRFEVKSKITIRRLHSDQLVKYSILQ